MPSQLDFFNNSESENIPSFPNTPRQSQDGSRPPTPRPLTPHLSVDGSRPSTPRQSQDDSRPATPVSMATGGRENLRSRRWSAAKELCSGSNVSDCDSNLDSNDLGVKPLVSLPRRWAS